MPAEDTLKLYVDLITNEDQMKNLMATMRIVEEMNTNPKARVALRQQYEKTKEMVDKQKEQLGITKRFRFEWLNLIFTGMILQRLFGSYVDKVLEMTGITELFSTAMEMFAFQALEPFLGNIYGLLEGMYGLPQPIQQTIGAIMWLTTAFGAALVPFANFMLLVSSLKTTGGLAGMAVQVKAVTVEMYALIAPVAAVVALLYSIYYVWKMISEVVEKSVRYMKEAYDLYQKGDYAKSRQLSYLGAADIATTPLSYAMPNFAGMGANSWTASPTFNNYFGNQPVDDMQLHKVEASNNSQMNALSTEWKRKNGGG